MEVDDVRISRRAVVRGGVVVAGASVLGACNTDSVGGTSAEDFTAADSQRVADAEAARNPGKVREFALNPVESEIDLGGVVVPTWTYDGKVPGEVIRVSKGEQIKAVVSNGLPDPTTVHWHGVALRCDADGTPGVTQDEIASGAEFVYQFTAPDSGTFWFHPHSGVQQDRGLYAPLIVDDPDDSLDYDEEWIVVLDDWLDGVEGMTPDAKLAELGGGMDHGGHGGHGGGDENASDILGPDSGDVEYPYYLVNGRVAADPETFEAKPGARVRIRFVNAGGDTPFRVGLGGHRMTVTHTDGFAVEPAETDALLIGMGERYDVLVDLDDGVFPLVASAEGKGELARAIVRTGKGDAPPADAVPDELSGHIVGYDELTPAEAVRLPDAEPDRTVDLDLTGDEMMFEWGFNGKPYNRDELYAVAEGERVRLRFANTTEMWHPVHLHGHTFAIVGSGIRKDTANVLPDETLEVDFDAVNPGQWMIHCHNVYHSEAGMMTLLGYKK
ncbi:MAG: multicopper oxidase family protein [Stackebrandtia sp.]